MKSYSCKEINTFLIVLFSIVILGVLVFLLPTAHGSYGLTQACVTPPSGLVSWWPGDGNANDLQGNNPGTLQGGATFVSGTVSQAFSFDGADDFMNVPDAPSLTLGAAPFTIDLWVKFNQLKGRDPFISHDESSGDQNKWIFWYDDQGHGIGGPALRFHVNGPTIGAVDPIIAPWNPNVGQWYYIAVTRDGALYALYIDGVQVATATNSLTIPDPAVSLMIGRAEGNSFNGLIDEVDLFNRALSASEIQAIYNAGSAGKCKSQPPPPPPPTPTPCSRIAFDSTRDGNNEIYVMNADGMGQTNLTNNTANDVRASFSRDGNKIAFGSNRDGNYEIYVMYANGANQTRLTNNSADDYIPNFSPDGSKIVFESTRNGSKDHEEIYVMNADGTGQTRLTYNPTRDGNPAFSPDGSKIIFESNRNGNLEIYVMNADGTNPTRLTDNSADDGDPIFSPDGSKIAFETKRDNEYWEIYVMNADGSGQTRLTYNTANDTDPFFSPDGSRIAFETDRAGAGNYEVYVMSADGTGQANLTTSPAHDFSPSWTGCNVNRPPSFFPPTIISRVNGAPAKRSVIARVRDAETPTGNLMVAVFSAPGFISVTNLTNDNGSISADVAVNCAPSPGFYFVSLRVTDSGGLTGFGTFRITVTEAALSYSSPIPISFNSARVVMPDKPPEGFASFAVSAPNFGGNLSVDQVTGVVRISRARPTGSYTITVAATNFCGVTLTHSFTLIVTNGNTEYQGAVGEPIPPNAPEQGSKGSILIFNLYTSSSGENTRITLTNRHPTLSAALHLFFVANDGSTANTSRCVPADSSTSFLASEVDPGVRGFLIALAVNAATGSPMSFNYLTGKEDIWLASGHSATDVRAETFQALFPEGSSLPIVSDKATINFDDISYSRAARTLSLEDVPNPDDGNNTILVFNRIGGNLNSNLSPIGSFSGLLYEKSAPENFNSFNASATRVQFFSTLSDSFPVTTPSFSQLLSSGKDWRMVFQASNDLGLAGLALNRGPVKLNKNLLTPLALTRAASLTVPVFSVIGCQ